MITREELENAKEKELIEQRDCIKAGMAELEEYIDKRLKSAYINAYDFSLNHIDNGGLWYFLTDKYYRELMEVLEKYTSTYRVIVDNTSNNSMWCQREIIFKLNGAPGLEIINEKIAEDFSPKIAETNKKRWWEFWK